jgi:hypothetical protein
MRSLLLASAAVLFTAGIACAQTASPTPAPEGAPNAPQASTAPGASYGKTAPTPAAQPDAMSSSSASSSSSMAAPSPAPEGAPNAPQESTAPGASYGKTASAPAPVTNTDSGTMGQNTAASGDSAMGAGTKHMHHMWSGTSMPADADARTYLHIASAAIRHHDKATADEALSRAETRMLTRSVPASGVMTDDSPSITAVENARQAVDAGNFQQAAADTDQAMHHHMMGGMGNGMGKSSMGDQSGGAAMPGQGTSSPGMSAGASSGAQQ